MPPLHWKCPFCNRDTTVTDSNRSYGSHEFNENNYIGDLVFRSYVTVCPHPSCKRIHLKAVLQPIKRAYASGQTQTTYGKFIQEWTLIPEAELETFPDYIPKQILEDYREACLIRDKSPKASAALSRRCLQGMIRDFWKISKNTLKAEIDQLEGIVDGITWHAIDSVRVIGNIGAHMEKDINVIVEVDPGEAGLLIGLIETLIKDWYVRLHEKNVAMQALIETAASKREQQKSGK